MSKLNTTEISAKDFKAKLDTMTRNAIETITKNPNASYIGSFTESRGYS